jgi:hypothetical protein
VHLCSSIMFSLFFFSSKFKEMLYRKKCIIATSKFTGGLVQSKHLYNVHQHCHILSTDAAP